MFCFHKQFGDVVFDGQGNEYPGISGLLPSASSEEVSIADLMGCCARLGIPDKTEDPAEDP